jgi:hypothetical protein
MTEIKDQPKPTANVNEAIWDLVISDMKDRDEVGRERYGTPLQGFNGRDALVDAYQEALDMVVYLRQAIWERDFGKQEVNIPFSQILTNEPQPETVITTTEPPKKPFIMTSADVYV